MENKIKISGIYCYENLIDSKRYTGQSQDIYDREKNHLYALKSEKCADSKYFKNAWRKYGAENFKFWIVEECAIELLDEREIYWIKELRSHVSEWGYNISWGGGAPMRGLRHSEESRRKMSSYWTEERRLEESLSKIGNITSNETKIKISQSSPRLSGKDNPMWGKHHSEETRRRQSEANMGRILSEETRRRQSDAKSGENHPMWGKHLSEEIKEKISKSMPDMSGKNHPQWGTHPSAETKQKLSDASQLYWTEDKKKIRSEASVGENNPMFGKKHTPEAREKQSKAWSAERRKKQSNSKRLYWKNKREQGKM
jgi:group I intron endonuclease